MATTIAEHQHAEVTLPSTTRVAPVLVGGRDLAVFLVLLIATDFSGLLHIYGLGWLYSENLFLGLGWAMVMCALALVVWPASVVSGQWSVVSADETTTPTQNSKLKTQNSIAFLLLAVLATLAGGFLLRALTMPPGWVAPDPGRDTSTWGMATKLGLQLAAVLGVPGLALLVAYTRREWLRRLLLAALAVGLYMFSLLNLLFLDGVGRVSDDWAKLGEALPCLIVPIALAGLALTRLEGKGFLILALSMGLILRVLGLLSIPLTIRLGDMLPLIYQAGNRLLAGQNPYITYQMPWELPLTYWPLTLISYLPSAAAGLDLRLTNLFCGLGIGLLLILAGGRRGPGAAGYAYGLLYLTPTMFQWEISTAAPPYWFWLAVAAAVTVRWSGALNNLAPGLAAGAALTAGPLALPFMPFLGLDWLRDGLRPALMRVAAAAAVLALLVGPFLLWDRAGFWNGAVSWFNDLDRLPMLKWQTDKSWLMEIGLAGPLWQAGLQAWLKPLQLLLLGGLALAALLTRAIRTHTDALRWGAAAYLLFMVVNPVIWPYLYEPALIVLVFALLPSAEGGDDYVKQG